MARYCSTAELVTYGMRAEALRGISIDEQNAAIDAASDECDGYLGARYTLPLVSWENDLRMNCARLAVYTLMVTRGFNPMAAGDEQIAAQRDIAERWLYGIANGKISPRVTDSSSGATPGKISGGVQVSSYRSRGYSTPDSSSCAAPFTGRR